jgi:hypothetical protein
VTLKTIPSPEVITLTFQFTTSASSPNAFGAVAYFLGQFPRLADAGVSGYPIIFQKAANSSDVTGRSLVTGVIGKVIMLDTRDKEDILSLFRSVFQHIDGTWPGEFEFYTNATYHPSFGAWCVPSIF